MTLLPAIGGTRITCLRCRRPERVCVCAELRPMASRTRVVFVQHPREARMPVSTCRLAHLSLPNSEMHVALGPEGNPRLEALARAPGTMLLFPGPGSTDVTELSEPPRTLVVVDGTWINARKVVERSPLLSALPRIGFSPARPGNYRIRKEPAAHCLSTIEAVAYVLEALEAAPGRFTPILGSFDRMVDQQLAYIEARALPTEGTRHRPKDLPAGIERLRALGDRRVLVFADGNAWPDGDGPLGPPELLHWVAVRPATGARFESLLRPSRPVPPYVPARMGVSAAALDDGEPRAGAMERWRRFGAAGDGLCTWGRYTTDLVRAAAIEAAGEPIEPLDIKHLVASSTNARLGGVELLAERLGASLPDGVGRAARTLAALDVVVRALTAGELRRKAG